MRPFRTRACHAVAIITALSLSACSEAPPRTAAGDPPAPTAPLAFPSNNDCPQGVAFGHTQANPEGLAAAFLQALRSNDLASLEALALNEQEFRCRVWPHLPASRPERGLTADYVWGDLHQKSSNSLAFTRRDFGGRELELRRAWFAGPTTDYAAFRVHRDSRLTVLDEAGRVYNLQLFGSVLEVEGRFKIFSFVTD